MEIWHSVVLGIVEGVTEFLPISSTAHLLLTGEIFGIPQTEFVKSFDIAIQLGAILAVVVLYWRKLLVDIATIKRVIIAFIPTAVLGLLLYKVVKNYLMTNLSIIVWSLIIGGVVLIIFEYWHKRKESVADTATVQRQVNDISYKECLILGLCQVVAMIPGVSRSGATIVGGMLLGLPRTTIVEFSFLLAVPTMLSATGFDLVKSNLSFGAGEIGLFVVGFITAFVVALIVVKWLLSYVQRHDFTSFGIYRIIAGLIFLWLVI